MSFRVLSVSFVQHEINLQRTLLRFKRYNPKEVNPEVNPEVNLKEVTPKEVNKSKRGNPKEVIQRNVIRELTQIIHHNRRLTPKKDIH